MSAAAPTARPVVEQALVTAVEEVGAYRRITLAAPGLAAGCRPGQFVAVAVGEEPTATLLRRAFSVHGVDAETGLVQLVVADAGVGSGWVTRRRSGDLLDVVGPLGRPFPQPGDGAVVLVGGGYGSAPLLWWARELADAGHRVDLVIGAGDAARLFLDEPTVGPVGAGRPVTVHVTTDDGSAGVTGRVTVVLPQVLSDATAAVYACGPMPMLQAVHEATPAGVPTWLTVEESMACGVGICMTCVLPVRDDTGATRMTRTCVEGPTFAGSAVRWDALVRGGARVPDDCVGAPRVGGH